LEKFSNREGEARANPNLRGNYNLLVLIEVKKKGIEGRFLLEMENKNEQLHEKPRGGGSCSLDVLKPRRGRRGTRRILRRKKGDDIENP